MMQRKIVAMNHGRDPFAGDDIFPFEAAEKQLLDHLSGADTELRSTLTPGTFRVIKNKQKGNCFSYALGVLLPKNDGVDFLYWVKRFGYKQVAMNLWALDFSKHGPYIITQGASIGAPVHASFVISNRQGIRIFSKLGDLALVQLKSLTALEVQVYEAICAVYYSPQIRPNPFLSPAKKQSSACSAHPL